MDVMRHVKNCPFCGSELNPTPPYCRHFIGWTDDGKKLEQREPCFAKPDERTVLPTDLLLHTGVSVRVFRDC